MVEKSGQLNFADQITCQRFIRLNLTNQEHELFKVWANQYPPDEWDHNASRIQGNHNPFIQKNN